LSLGLKISEKMLAMDQIAITSLLGVAIPSTSNAWRKILNNCRMFS
jgi:hypothetical protein